MGNNKAHNRIMSCLEKQNRHNDIRQVDASGRRWKLSWKIVDVAFCKDNKNRKSDQNQHHMFQAINTTMKVQYLD
jgi:hypothetical protein